MAYPNKLNFTLPYFASKEKQTLYVVIPSVNPILFKQPHEDDVHFSIEEEILPDFRCKICSVRISTYSEFKAHQRDHEKTNYKTKNYEEDELQKSYLLEADGVQLLRNSNSELKSNQTDNFKNSSKFDPIKHSSHLRTVESANGVHNKILLSEIASNALQEEYKRNLSSSKTVSSLYNSVCSLNNSKMSVSSKFKELSEMQNEMLDTEWKKSNSPELPLIHRLNKWGTYTPTSRFSNATDASLSHIKDSYRKSILYNENSPVTNQIHSSTISREIIQERTNEILTAESSASNVTLTLSYTGLKQVVTPCKKKKVAQIIKPYSVSSNQSKLTVLSTDDKNSEWDITQERRFRIGAHSLADTSNYFENDTSIADNTAGETSVCDKSKPYNIILLTKEQDKLPVKKILAHEKSFLNGIVPGSLSEKGTKQMINKSQPLGGKSISDVTKSEYTHVGKTTTEEIVKYNDSRPLKTSALQSPETSKRGVYILEPSTTAKEKPMRCFYCQKTFKSCVQMRRHLLLHKESKTVFCAMCNLFFSRVCTFRSHLLVFHCQAKDGKKCPYCEYRCFRTSNLENHLLKTHFKYKCIYCTMRFTTLKKLNNHQARKHLH